jgi:Uma2 family endonuclease
MAVEKQLHTIEDFVAFTEQPENADRLFELINGEIVEKMPGRASNSAIETWFIFFVRLFCREHHFPCFMTTGDGTYNVLGHAVAPDFAYGITPFTGAFPEPFAPLWAVEIISPNDRPDDIRDKRLLYLQADILYFELYPKSQSIDVYAPGQPMRTYDAGNIIDLSDLIPGFTLAVKDIFATE